MESVSIESIIKLNKLSTENRLSFLRKTLEISYSSLAILGEKVAPQVSYPIIAQLARECGGMNEVAEGLESSIGSYTKAVLALTKVNVSEIIDLSKAYRVYEFLISVSQSGYRYSILSNILWFYRVSRKKETILNTLEGLSRQVLLIDSEYFMESIGLHNGQESLIECFSSYIKIKSVKKRLNALFKRRKIDSTLETLLLWGQYAPEVDIFLDDITTIWNSDLSLDTKESVIKWVLVQAYLSTLTNTELSKVWEITDYSLNFSLRETIASIVDGIAISILNNDVESLNYLIDLYFQRFRI